MDKDAAVATTLKNYEVEVTYILDEVISIGASDSERSNWYQDTVHLTPDGHRVWGDVIYKELSNAFGLR